jgi:hypothetical protein
MSSGTFLFMVVSLLCRAPIVLDLTMVCLECIFDMSSSESDDVSSFFTEITGISIIT